MVQIKYVYNKLTNFQSIRVYNVNIHGYYGGYKSYSFKVKSRQQSINLQIDILVI